MKQLLIERLGSPVANRIDTSPRRRMPAWVIGGLSSLAAGVVLFAAFDARYEQQENREKALQMELARVEAERVLLRQEHESIELELEVADEEIMEVEAEVRALQADALNTANQLAMLRSTGVVAMSIVGTERQPDASARVFWGEDYYCYLVAKELRRLDEGRAYAFWLDTEDGGTIFVGHLTPDALGVATLWVPLDRNLGPITRAFLTEEVEGDPGQEPTGAVELESATPASA